MSDFFHSHPQLTLLLLAAAAGLVGVLELLILQRRDTAIVTWVLGGFLLFAWLMSVAGLGDFYMTAIPYLVVLVVVVGAVIVIIRRLRARGAASDRS